MADITITVTADPQQAIQGLEKVRKEADRLAETQRKVQEASDASATDAINSISSVSREVAQTISQTGAGLGSVSAGIRTAGSEASKVAGAFGKSIPVIGQLGSAVSSALTGPVAAVSAAIGLAIAQISKMIAEVEDRVQRLKMSAGAQASSAYDAILKGREKYAQDLQTLAQVRQFQSVARKSGLTDAQLKQFRGLASQIGIESRYVGATGIRSGQIEAAEKSLKQQRRFYAEQEYKDYISALSNQLQRELASSKLSDAAKKSLSGRNLSDLAAEITARARRGAGGSTEEFQAYQDLYNIVKPLAEVQASYRRDRMLGRSQADLNAAAVSMLTGATGTAAVSDRGAAGGTGSAAVPGTLAWQKEQDKKAAAAAEQERKEQERRANAGARLTEGLERQIRLEELIRDGKQKEAFILRNRLSMEDAIGRALTAAEAADNERLAATLYDLQHPVIPQPEPAADPGSSGTRVTRARTRAASTAAAAAHLDRLQRIGANVARAAASPEKLVLDKSYAIQEKIYSAVQLLASGANNNVMRF